MSRVDTNDFFEDLERDERLRMELIVKAKKEREMKEKYEKEKIEQELAARTIDADDGFDSTAPLFIDDGAGGDVAVLDVDELTIAALSHFDRLKMTFIVHGIVFAKAEEKLLKTILTCMKKDGPHALNVRNYAMKGALDEISAYIQGSDLLSNADPYKQKCKAIFKDVIKNEVIEKLYHERLRLFDRTMKNALLPDQQYNYEKKRTP